MDVIVVLDYRFDRTPDGAVWTSGTFAYPFWQRYLQAFDAVRVVARIRLVDRVPADYRVAHGSGVTFVEVPDYLGPVQYLARAARVRRAVRGAPRPGDAVILRVPSNLAAVMMPALTRTGRPYGVEVVGNPRDGFAPGAIKHPLRAYFRWSFDRALRRQCAGATAAGYVTREALQRAYPNPRHSVGVSDVEIPPQALLPVPRQFEPTGPRRLIFVGSLSQLYKAPDVLINAVGSCVFRHGLDLSLTLVGDGRHRPELEDRARERGVGDRVRFLGQLAGGQRVWAELDRCDLFVLPSRTEGLPRAMIEAMARALPCIGSTVGGIPELLPLEDLVPPGDPAALAEKIREVVIDPGRLARMSARNLAVAHEYRQEVLRDRRQALYAHLRGATERWIARPPS